MGWFNSASAQALAQQRGGFGLVVGDPTPADLDHDVAIERRVDRPQHVALAAAAQPRHDAILANGLRQFSGQRAARLWPGLCVEGRRGGELRRRAVRGAKDLADGRRTGRIGGQIEILIGRRASPATQAAVEQEQFTKDAIAQFRRGGVQHLLDSRRLAGMPLGFVPVANLVDQPQRGGRQRDDLFTKGYVHLGPRTGKGDACQPRHLPPRSKYTNGGAAARTVTGGKLRSKPIHRGLRSGGLSNSLRSSECHSGSPHWSRAASIATFSELPGMASQAA